MFKIGIRIRLTLWPISALAANLHSLFTVQESEEERRRRRVQVKRRDNNYNKGSAGDWNFDYDSAASACFFTVIIFACHYYFSMYVCESKISILRYAL